MYYLHHRVDENTNYVVDTSDWTMNVLDDANTAGAGVSASCPVPGELDAEDTTVSAFWDHFASSEDDDVNAYLMSTELYPLTQYLASKLGTFIRFDAKIDIYKNDAFIFCRGYTGHGHCICWYSDGSTMEVFAFSGLDINEPYVDNVEEISAAWGKSLWNNEGFAAVFYTPKLTKIAFVRFHDGNGICRPELLSADYGRDGYLYDNEDY